MKTRSPALLEPMRRGRQAGTRRKREAKAKSLAIILPRCKIKNIFFLQKSASDREYVGNPFTYGGQQLYAPTAPRGVMVGVKLAM